MDCISSNPRYDWLPDISQSSDINRCVPVGIVGIAARLTEKLGLRLAVSFVTMPALAARATGIAWVNFNQKNTRKLCFVCEKTLELKKAPAMQVVSLTALNLYPPSDTRQLFDRYSKAVAFGSLNDGLANNVIRVFCEAGLTTREFFKLAFSRLRTAFLQALAKATVLAAYLLDLSAAVRLPEAVRRQLDHAHIDAKVALNIFGRRLWNRARRQEIEAAPDVNEVRLALLKLEQLELTLTCAEQHLLSTRKRPNRHTKLVELPFQDAVIVCDCAMWLKRPKSLFIQLVGIGNFGLTANHHLRTEFKLLFGVVVPEFVKGKLTKRLGIPRCLRQIVTRLIRPFKGFKEHPMLFRTRKKLDFRRQFHALILPQFSSVEHAGAYRSGSQFIPRMNDVGFLAAAQ